MFLRQSPLLRLLLPLIGGITTGYLFPVPGRIRLMVLVLLTALLIMLLLLPALKSHALRWGRGWLMVMVFFAVGWHSEFLNNALNDNSHFMYRQKGIYIARITDPPDYSGKVIKVNAEVEEIVLHDSLIPAVGKVILFLAPGIDTLVYGSRIAFNRQPDRFKPPLNPGEFDYASFLSRRNIFHTAYLKANQWKIVPGIKTNPLFALSYHLRAYLIMILEENLKDKDIYSVASALLVGYEEDIDRTLLKSYSASGTLHVLSVSGMHVALIYKVLEWLLSFLKRKRWGRSLFYFLIILLVWFYSMLSGLAPSVLRASAMLTLMVAGKWFSRSSSIYNTLVVSCFVLITFNPMLIFEVGFQLSLMAVAGIVFIHPLIFRWFTPKGKLLYILWSMISISVAAQLMTFPIGLYYFHQFPNLFLLSNIIIIPLTTAAIYGCIALVVLAGIPLLGYLSGKVVYLSIWLSNSAANLYEQIPGAVTNGISINSIEVMLLYILIITTSFFLIRKQPLLFYVIIALGCCISAGQLYENCILRSRKMITVFGIKDHTCIDFFKAGRSYLLTDLPGPYDNQFQSYQTGDYTWRNSISRHQLLTTTYFNGEIYRHNHMICFEGLKIFLVDSTEMQRNLITTGRIKCDLLLLTGNPVVNIDRLLANYEAEWIVIATSVKKSRSAKLKAEFLKHNVNCHNVWDDGAFIWSFNNSSPVNRFQKLKTIAEKPL